MLEFEGARIVIAIVLTAVLAIEDGMTSFMDQNLLYAMILLGAVLDLLTFDKPLMFAAGVGAVIIFGIGYYYYRKGEVGGGDVLLLCGLHLLFPYPPTMVSQWAYSVLGVNLNPLTFAVLTDFNSVIPFVVSVLVTATLLGLIYTAISYAWKLNWNRPKPDFTYGGLALIATILVLGSSLLFFGLKEIQFVVYLAAFLPAVFLAAFGKQIKEELIVEQTPISGILDEDVLVTELMDEKIVKKYSLGRVVTASELEKLKEVCRKERISKFPIARDLPRFGPFLLLGLLISLVLGNVIVLLLLS